MVNLNLILLLVGAVVFIKFGGAKIVLDFASMAKNDLTLFKEGLKSDNVVDIQSKTEAGLSGQEG